MTWWRQECPSPSEVSGASEPGPCDMSFDASVVSRVAEPSADRSPVWWVLKLREQQEEGRSSRTEENLISL